MSFETGGESSFLLEPGQHSYAALAPLVEHPELSSERLHERGVAYFILPAIMSLAHAALLQKDPTAYMAWSDCLAGRVADLQAQLPSDMAKDSQHYYGQLVATHCLGTIYGDAQTAENAKGSADVLLSNATKRVKTAVAVCARERQSPQYWIDRHLRTADERAGAWDTYIAEAEAEAESLGKNIDPAAFRELGATRFIDDYLGDEITSEVVVKSAATVYSLARDAAEKRAVVDRFMWALDDLPYLHFAQHGEAARFVATGVVADPEQPLVLQQEVMQRTSEKFSGQEVAVESAGVLAVSGAIMAGRGASRIMGTVQAITNQAYEYDHLLGLAAGICIERREFTKAAELISNIDGTSFWALIAEEYMRARGDGDDLLFWDMTRAGADSQRVSASKMSAGYPQPNWAVRRGIGGFLENLAASNFISARAGLETIARTAKDDPTFMPSDVLHRLAAICLHRDQQSSVIGPSVIAAARAQGKGFEHIQDFYDLFVLYGNQEIEAENWMRAQASPNRVTYFMRYAAATLLRAQMQTGRF